MMSSDDTSKTFLHRIADALEEFGWKLFISIFGTGVTFGWFVNDNLVTKLQMYEYKQNDFQSKNEILQLKKEKDSATEQIRLKDLLIEKLNSQIGNKTDEQKRLREENNIVSKSRQELESSLKYSSTEISNLKKKADLMQTELNNSRDKFDKLSKKQCSTDTPTYFFTELAKVSAAESEKNVELFESRYTFSARVKYSDQNFCYYSLISGEAEGYYRGDVKINQTIRGKIKIFGVPVSLTLMNIIQNRCVFIMQPENTSLSNASGLQQKRF